MELSPAIKSALNLPEGFVASEYQCAAFNWAMYGTENVVIVAVAGSGKTTTGVYLVRCLPAGQSYIFLAFNKDIADELKTRGVKNASTFHSACNSVVARHFKYPKMEKNKLRLLCDESLTDIDSELYEQFIVKLVGLARQMGMATYMLADTPTNWLKIIDDHGMELASDDADMDRAILLASKLLQASNDCCRNMIDFDDMIYQVVKCNLTMPKYDNILIDEMQDTNAIQLECLAKMMHSKSRIGGLADPCQAIYLFRGAGSNSVSDFRKKFNCVDLPLTISYRCPQAVVRHAQQWVSHIQASPTAIEGEVKFFGGDWKVEQFNKGDLIGCRTTAPLVKLAYSMLRKHIPCYVMGKDISEGLVSLIKRMKAKGIEKLQEKLAIWSDREIKKAMDKKDESKAELISERVACINVLIDSLEETDRTIPGLITIIQGMFADRKDKKDRSTVVALGTIHRLKGLEAHTVYWLNSSQCPSKWAKTDEQREQEKNLCYVMTTRAQKALYMIEDGSNKAENT